MTEHVDIQELPLADGGVIAGVSPKETRFCDQCGSSFAPRNGSGGKPQRFCSPTCRAESNRQRPQRGPTYSSEKEVSLAGKGDEPSPHERRAMLIRGVEDFDGRQRHEAAPELVDRCIAEGKVSLLPGAPADDEMDSDKFEWGGEKSIVLAHQPATAVYVNKEDSVVIRQERPWYQEEDSIVLIRPELAVKFCKRLLDVAGFGDVHFARRQGGGFVDLE